MHLEKGGVNVTAGKINYLRATDSKKTIETDQVHARAVSAPYTAIVKAGGAVPVITAEGVSNGYGLGVARHAALADDPRAEAINDLLERIERAYQWTNDNPEKWEKIFAQETGTDAEAAKINTRSTRLQIPFDQTVIISQNDLIGAFERADVLPDVFDFADQVDVRFED